MRTNYFSIYSILIVLTILSGCSQTSDKSSVVTHFTYADFKEERQLNNPQELTMDSLLYPASFYLMRDTLIVVNNQPECEYLMEIYSLNNLNKPLLQIAPKGSGPDDLVSCTCFIHDNENAVFDVQSPATNTLYRTNIDSILKNKKFCAIDKFQYTSLAHTQSDICSLNDDSYVAYNIWYIDDPTYSNGIATPLQKYSKKATIEAPAFLNNFVAPVNGARIFYNSQKHEIWSMDLHKDRIHIYDDSLRLIKEIIGPDNLEPKYTEVKSNAPFTFISFANNESYMAYIDYCLTANHIYLIYSGDSHYSSEDLRPVNVFKLKYDGTLECVYHLDRHLLTISVDSKEEYLYGTAKKSLSGYASFVRYKL